MTALRDRRILLIMTLLLSLMSGICMAQDEGLKSLQLKFENFGRYAEEEKIYLHTDKTFYLAGEIVWFKIYCVDGTLRRPKNLSKVAYLEVLDRTNKPVLQAKIPLTVNGGSGSLYLPLTLNSDNYTLRAYTNWMKNSGASVFFEKPISVINTIKPAEASLLQDSMKVTATFFPEGGNLVQGIETKIAFQVTGLNGKGMDAHGIITNDNGDTIKKFSTYKFGLGNFAFRPVAGQKYKATIVLTGGGSFTSPLPGVYDNGYVMNVTDNKDDRIKIRVQARGKEIGQRGENVFLLAHTKQKLKIAEPGFVNYENELVLFIDKKKLAEGINYLTLFNKDQQPVCERLVFIPPQSNSLTNISIDKDGYEKRHKVNLSISTDSAAKYPGNANYSVAVFQVDSMGMFEQDDIASYLWLTSELRGIVESPGFYLTKDADGGEATDNLLLTHGWRRFRWENVLSPVLHPTPKFIPEYRGHLVTAKVTTMVDGLAAANVECFLSTPGTPFGFYVSRTDTKGIAQFEVKDYYGQGDIIIQAGRDTINRYRIDVLTPFADEQPLNSLPFFSFEKQVAEALATKSIAMQAQNIYLSDSIRKFNSPLVSDTLPFFGKPEFSYRLDEYKRFTTMEEVLREYVRPINVILRNGSLYMTIYDEMYSGLYNDVSQAIYANNLLVLLDGVPLFNFNKIFSYDPLKVKKLEVVPRRYVIGGMRFNGIASFETYEDKFDGFELTPGVISVDYEGLQLQREFYSPVYETTDQKEKRVPDYRSTLYWAPDVPTDQSGKAAIQFYTSDLAGRFLVILQGFNANGRAISVSRSFTVE